MSGLFLNSRQDLAASSHVSHMDEPKDYEPPKRPVTPYENTYIMDGPEKKFSKKQVEDAINEVLKEQLEEEEYDPRSSRQMAKTLSTIITNRVKALDFPRYKIVSLVTVGQLDDQGIRVASRCLMDQGTDQWASGCFKNKSLFCVATVYGMYYE